ncbi:sigma-70 family RNA polymerase sigma factor [Candidatus Kaiserbacteria bacterium]|nr:sigma-70 family RNA polymerase sigma factor [Candidatus Kaiserbacteria bacterium]
MTFNAMRPKFGNEARNEKEVSIAMMREAYALLYESYAVDPNFAKQAGDQVTKLAKRMEKDLRVAGEVKALPLDMLVDGKMEPGIILSMSVAKQAGDRRQEHMALLGTLRRSFLAEDDASPIVKVLKDKGIRRVAVRVRDMDAGSKNFFHLADVILSPSNNARQDLPEEQEGDDAEKEANSESGSETKMEWATPVIGERQRAVGNKLMKKLEPKPVEKRVRRRSTEVLSFEDGLVRLRPKLFGFAMKLTHNDYAESENLVQLTFFKALNARDQFQEGTNLEAWAFTILRNSNLSDLRIQTHRKTYGGEAAETAILNTGTFGNQESAMELKETFEHMKLLPAEQREALKLVALQGFSYAEAARKMGVADGTIKSRVNRAREMLKWLRDGDEESGDGEAMDDSRDEGPEDESGTA